MSSSAAGSVTCDLQLFLCFNKAYKFRKKNVRNFGFEFEAQTY